MQLPHEAVAPPGALVVAAEDQLLFHHLEMGKKRILARIGDIGQRKTAIDQSVNQRSDGRVGAARVCIEGSVG
jgi:hypothetical protein